jgi:vitamin B12 transporter
VLVMIDGVPLTKQDTTGTVSLEHIMLDSIERVEIVRGNVSAIYGSGAVGGVIQLFTRKGQGKPAGYAQLEAGSFGTVRAAAGVGGQVGDTRFALGVAGHRTTGISAIDVAQHPGENPDVDGYRNANFNLSLSQAAGAGPDTSACAPRARAAALTPMAAAMARPPISTRAAVRWATGRSTATTRSPPTGAAS